MVHMEYLKTLREQLIHIMPLLCMAQVVTVYSILPHEGMVLGHKNRFPTTVHRNSKHRTCLKIPDEINHNYVMSQE